MLAAIGVPAYDANAERDAMQHWAVRKTANRRVLGSRNNLAVQFQFGLLEGSGCRHHPLPTLIGFPSGPQYSENGPGWLIGLELR